VFACLFLDSKNRFLCFEVLFYGSLNSTTIHAREIVKCALACNAASVIFAHNHPSGNSEPSREDRQVTECLKNALAWVDVCVLDHLVVGNNTTSAFTELGFL
jgi:DNA repair protein RadC